MVKKEMFVNPRKTSPLALSGLAAGILGLSAAMLTILAAPLLPLALPVALPIIVATSLISLAGSLTVCGAMYLQIKQRKAEADVTSRPLEEGKQSGFFLKTLKRSFIAAEKARGADNFIQKRVLPASNVPCSKVRR